MLTQLGFKIREPPYDLWAEKHKEDSDYLIELDLLQRIYGLRHDIPKLKLAESPDLEKGLIGKDIY
jgi:hypothetical protein